MPEPTAGDLPELVDLTDQTLAELSTGHAVALRLRRAGVDDATIAAALGIPVEGVAARLQIAVEKARRVASQSTEGPPDP